MFNKLNLAILTPIFWGSGTGAAIYYQLLTRYLAQKGFQFLIISEKSNIAQNNTAGLDYIGLFPNRSGKDRQIIQDIFKYSIQNLGYFYLPFLLKREKINSVLVHTSFYNLPGFFPSIMNYLIDHEVNKYVADVRDVLLPKNKISHLARYHSIIACSMNVQHHLIKGGIDKQKITYIPVIQEEIRLDYNQAQSFLSKNNLGEKDFILYAGMIKTSKAVDLLIKAFVDFISPSFPNLFLVLAGYIKTTEKYILNSLKNPKIIHINNLDRSNVLNLMTGAKLCINLSPNEGMPRSSLEALTLNRPVILPPNVPEFMQYAPQYVANSRDPQKIAHQIINGLENQEKAKYPIEQHSPAKVMQKYYELLA